MTLPAYKRKGVSRPGLSDAGAFKLLGLAGTIELTNAGVPTNGTSGTGAGVAPPGSLLIDTTNKTVYQNTNTKASPTWTLRMGGLDAASVTDAITASATQTLAGGTALTTRLNRVSVSAASGNAVTLAALAPGQSQTIYNDGANPIKVFPNAAGYQIDGNTAGASVPLANAARCTYTCYATNQIISAKLGVVSA